MADSITLSLLSTVPVPNSVLSTKSQPKCSVLFRRNRCLISSKIGTKCSGMRSSTRLYAGLTEIEPDINEDPVDRWRTNGIDIEDYVFGKYDDHHTYFESEDKACYQGAVQSYGLQKQRVQLNSISKAMRTRRLGSAGRQKKGAIRCNIELQDFIGGDLIKLDLGQWLSDVEEHKAIAIYSPHEGGYEGRYLTRLKYQGYHFLDLSARGLGDPETTLTKFHPVCPAHVGKQPIARWYFPPEVDYRLSLLPPDAKGLVVWIIEAKVLSKEELQFLALLPTLRPNVRVIAECGNWRKFMWKPLKEIAGLSQS